MRIVHVDVYHHPPLGYASFYLPFVQQKLGCDVSVVTSDRYAPFPNYHETIEPILGPRYVGACERYERGVLTIRLRGVAEWRNRLWLRGFSRRMAELSPDIIHVHDAVTLAPFQSALAARRQKCGLVVTSTMEREVVQNRTIGGKILYGAYTSFLGPTIRNQTSMFCGVSEGACLVLEEILSIPKDKVTLIPLGATDEVFQFDPEARSEIRQRIGVPDSAVVVMYAGKLIPSKDTHVLVEAWRRSAGDGMWLLLLGNGAPDYVASLRERVPASMAARFVMLPPVPNTELPKYFSAADIGVWPSESSNAAIEAAVLGLPIVVSDDLCSRHYVQDGNGSAFSRGDVTALTGLLDRLGADVSLRKRQQEIALRVVRRQRSWTAIAQRYLELYEFILRKRG